MKSKILIKRNINIGKNKVAGLNISVNAIVVFVLAFAMLGVGVAFINMIREQIMETGDLIDADDLQNPPSRDNPFTVPQRLTMSVSDTHEIQVGVFNNQAGTMEDTKVHLEDDTGGGSEALCLGTGNAGNGLFRVVAPSRTIEVGERAGYAVSISAEDDVVANERYICTMVARHDAGEIAFRSDVIIQTTS